MARFFSVPSKSYVEVDLKTPIKKYIETQYGTSIANIIMPELDKLNDLRRTALLGMKKGSEQSARQTEEYHDTLFYLESRVPMNEDGAKVDFKWPDSLGRVKKFHSSLHERFYVLYSLAALYSQIAERCDTRDEVSLKQALVSLKTAAGIFAYLASNPSMCARHIKDASIELLVAYSAAMLAQAQECVFFKVGPAEVKSYLKAQIASRVMEVYEDALKKCDIQSIKHIISTDWISTMKEKVALYSILAQFHQGKACEENKSYGEYVARVTNAYELAKSMSSRWGKSSVQLEQYKSARDKAVKENDLVYHESVPKTLAPIPAVGAIEKADVRFPLLGGELKDPFLILVPLPVMEAKHKTEAQLSSLLMVERQRLCEATEALNAVMGSLNLPAALQTSSSNTIPDDLLTKISKTQGLGGVSALRTSVFSLPGSLERNREILQQQLAVLKEEQATDEKLRKQFGDRWTRQPSSKLNESFFKDAQKMLDFLTQTQKTDDSLADRFNMDENNFELLSMSPDELVAKARAKKTSFTPSGNEPAREELAAVCSQLDTLKLDRGSLTDQLKAFTLSNDSISKLSQIHQQQGSVSPQAILDLLNEALEPVREAVRASETEQSRLLAVLQAKSEVFFGSSGGDGSSQDFVIRLAGAADRFTKLDEDVREGMKFYAEMTERCIKGQEKIDDFCLARNTEKTEAIADITSNLSKVSMGDAPQVPTSSPTTSSQQPPRPPATYTKPTAPPPPSVPAVASPAGPGPTPVGAPAMPPPGVYGGVPQHPGGWPPQPYGYGMPMPQLPPGAAPYDPSYAQYYPSPYGGMPPAYGPMTGAPPYGYYPGYMPGAAYMPAGGMPPQHHPDQSRPPPHQ